MKQLLLLYHSQSSRSETLALSCYQAAKQCLTEAENVSIVMRRCMDATVEDLQQAYAVLFIFPENFAAIAGGMKDFFDRVFYPAQRLSVKAFSYALIISAGNDGSRSLLQITNILKGFNAVEVQAPIIHYGDINDSALQRCNEQVQAMALGLELGMY